MKFKTIGAVALTTAVALTGCSASPQPTDGYSGKAIIQKTQGSGTKSGCYLYVKTSSGLVGGFGLGRRTSCNGWNPGNVVFLQDGHLLK
jgi:hypothetical protein